MDETRARRYRHGSLLILAASLGLGLCVGAPPGALAQGRPEARNGQPATDALRAVQDELRPLLVRCAARPWATPYGREYEWFVVRVVYEPSGRARSVEVRGREHPRRRHARVTRCVERARPALTVPPFEASAPVRVTLPLDGRWVR